MDNKEQGILKTAEDMVRKGGYNAFSFREIAKIVGIKSSSVHYYFPTKADLGAAVVRNYTDIFMQSLGNIEDLMKMNKDPIVIYIQIFKDALIKDKRMCLCGLLGAEINGLPDAVVMQTKVFFERNIAWLTQAYSAKGYNDNIAKRKAHQTLALLEGAMIISNTLGNYVLFDDVTKGLT